MSETPPRPLPRVKLWFQVDADYGFGAGLIQILQAVERTGSIKAAAADLGRSYRHVWDRVKRAEQAIGTPLVVTQVGGQGTQRSHLTDEARRLIDEFHRLRARLIAVLDAEGGGTAS